jgi:hypothetical protein
MKEFSGRIAVVIGGGSGAATTSTDEIQSLNVAHRLINRVP